MKKLILLLLLVSSNAFAWSLFNPKDNEECSVQAAKDANNRESLRVLLDYCDTEFPTRRMPEGGYEYYISKIGHYITVIDPKLNKSDWKKIKNIENFYYKFISDESKKPNGLSKNDIDWYFNEKHKTTDPDPF